MGTSPRHKANRRSAGGRKEETYWPVAVAQEKFHCIILKGGDKNPYFPRPLLSEFDFQIPISSNPPKDSSDHEEATAAARTDGSRFEESFVRGNILLSLFRDFFSSTNATSSQRSEMARKELDLDKKLAADAGHRMQRRRRAWNEGARTGDYDEDRNGKMLEGPLRLHSAMDEVFWKTRSAIWRSDE